MDLFGKGAELVVIVCIGIGELIIRREPRRAGNTFGRNGLGLYVFLDWTMIMVIKGGRNFRLDLLRSILHENRIEFIVIERFRGGNKCIPNSTTNG